MEKKWLSAVIEHLIEKMNCFLPKVYAVLQNLTIKAVQFCLQCLSLIRDKFIYGSVAQYSSVSSGFSMAYTRFKHNLDESKRCSKILQ